jgi:predicted nucleic acid-binding protein
MSAAKVFLDTNVLIYMYDLSQPEKRESSLMLIDTYDCITSTQAINEISNVLTKKNIKPLSDVTQVLEDIYLVCDVKVIQKCTIFLALNLIQRYGFSYYDSLMLASALENSCKTIYSEDMQHNQKIENRLTGN